MRVVLRFLMPLLMGVAGSALAGQPLVTPAQLQSLLEAGTVRLIDVRTGPAYAIEHLPGAVSAPYELWHAAGDNPGLVPPLDRLIQLVQSLGLTPETHAVIVYPGVTPTDFGGAARVYWTLKSLGMTDLSILDGGLSAWHQAGLPISKTPVTVASSRWTPTFSPDWMASRGMVRADLNLPGVLLVDARPPPYFEGHVAPTQARAHGTLPGAVNLNNELFFELGSSELMDQASLQSEADTLEAKPGETIITFCNAGHWSATDWFVLSELLNYQNVRMYPGSMVDWTNAQAPLPMANEPDRWEKLRYMVLDWMHRNLGTSAPVLG